MVHFLSILSNFGLLHISPPFEDIAFRKLSCDKSKFPKKISVLENIQKSRKNIFRVNVVPFSGSYSWHSALSALYNTLDILLPRFALHVNAKDADKDVIFGTFLYFFDEL